MYKLTTVKSHDCLLYERMSRGWAQNNFLDSGLIGQRNFWLIIKPRFWVVKTLNKNYPMRVSKPKLSFTWSIVTAHCLKGGLMENFTKDSLWTLFWHQTQNREHCMWQMLLASGKSDAETGKNLSMQLTEHKWSPRNGEVNNHIAENHFLCRWTIKSTGTLQHAIRILRTTITKENGLGLPVLLVFSTYQTSLTVPLMKLSRLERIKAHIINKKH